MNKPLAAAGTLALAVGLATGLSAAAPPAAAAPPYNEPYCGITWGSAGKSAPHTSSATVKDVRTGRHTCFDRMVVDLSQQVKGYDVEYTSVYREGSGQYVPLDGGADLRVTVKNPAYTVSGRPSYTPVSWTDAADVTGYSTFRQLAYAGSFEGQTTFGLGVRARLPFRVMILDGPGNGSRLVIDVAHRW